MKAAQRLARHYQFVFQKSWHWSPMAYWVHGQRGHPWPLDVTDLNAPRPVGRCGYPVLVVEFGRYRLQFSSSAQLEHCIEVLSRQPLPPAWRLCAERGLPFCSNSHWLSRLPAALKTSKMRAALVRRLQGIQTQVVGADGQFLANPPLKQIAGAD